MPPEGSHNSLQGTTNWGPSIQTCESVGEHIFKAQYLVVVRIQLDPRVMNQEFLNCCEVPEVKVPANKTDNLNSIARL